MKIAVDTRPMYLNKAGIRSYTKNIYKALKRAENKDLDVIECHGLDSRNLPRPNKSNIQKLVNGLSDTLWLQLKLPRLTKRLGADALICPSYVGPLVSSCHTLVVLHDMTYKLFPAYYNRWYLWYYRIMIPFVVRTAARIITISQSSKRDIARMLGVPEDKIIVAPIAASEVFVQSYTDREVRKRLSKYGLADTNYILYLGTIEGRKNLLRLLHAFQKLKKEKNVAEKLVIVGDTGWRGEYQRVMECIRQLSIGDFVTHIDYIHDKDVPYFYQGARLYVYPSLYEGFGITVLEAFLSKTPVVSSNVSSIPEVAGHAALLVNPYDVGAIAQAIYRALVDNTLRKKMIAIGHSRALQFTWDRTAALLISEIETLRGSTK